MFDYGSGAVSGTYAIDTITLGDFIVTNYTFAQMDGLNGLKIFRVRLINTRHILFPIF